MKEKLFEEYSFDVFSMAKQTLSVDPEGGHYLDRGDVEILDTKSVSIMDKDGFSIFEIETVMEDDLANELARLFSECRYDKDEFESAIEDKYKDRLI